jgi:hypothetical protein
MNCCHNQQSHSNGTSLKGGVEKLQGGLGFWAGNGGSNTTKILGLLVKVSSHNPPLLAFLPFIKWGARTLWARVCMKFECWY